MRVSLLIAVPSLCCVLASCGGGGGGGTPASNPAGPPAGGGGTPTPPTPTVTLPGPGKRVEETDTAMVFTGSWVKSDVTWGWSGDGAVQSNSAGATAAVTFTGTSVRWLGSRGRGMGIALVSVDGGPTREVDLFARPTDEVHTPVVTISDLSDGKHTLTIQVTGRQNNQAQGNVVVVDAFDVQPGTTVSHWQDTNPEVKYS